MNGLIAGVLALGLGVTVAMFGVVRAVILAPLPFADSSRLVTIETRMAGPDISGGFSSYLDFLDWRSQAASIDRMGAYAAGSVTLTGAGEPATLQTAFVSDDLLPMLGVAPIRGSLFQEGSDRGALPVVVISETLWRARLSADPNAVGRRLTLDDNAYTIVGILPAVFQFPIQPDPLSLWIPIGSHASTAVFQQRRGAGFLHVIGRLRNGSTVASAQADLAAIAARLATLYPLSNSNRVLVVAPMREDLVRDYRLQLLLLLGAAAAVLLTACANVAHLLVTRAMARQRELVIRAALGAGRGRLVRQLLTESLVLSSMAGLLGLVLAWWIVTVVVRELPTYIPRLAAARIDGLTLAVAAAASLLTGLLFGAMPAFRASTPDAAAVLRDTRGSSGRSSRALRIVVIAEVAISLVLLTTAGLLARSLAALQRVDPGFRADHLVLADLSLPNTRYPDAPARIAFYRRLSERLQLAPGVTSTAIATTLPLSGADLGAAFTIEGHPSNTPNGFSVAPYYSVSPGFFATLGIPIVAGRAFTDADDEHAPPVVVISTSLAKKYFPGEDPVGKRVRFGFGAQVWRQIVGIAGDVKQRELSQSMQPQFYSPFAQVPWPILSIIARTPGSTAVASAGVRQAIADVDANQPPGDIKTMEDYVSRSTATPSITASIVGGFAGFAALLAAIGLYGVMAHSVAARRRELGIRLALGAQPASLGWMVMREALVLCGGGLIAGLAGALAAARLVRGMLYGVGATDPVTFGAVCVLLAVVMIAAAIPATRRSLRADPLESLKLE